MEETAGVATLRNQFELHLVNKNAEPTTMRIENPNIALRRLNTLHRLDCPDDRNAAVLAAHTVQVPVA